MVYYWRQNNWQLAAINALVAIGVVLSANNCAAQSITLDGTLGTAKSLTGPNYTIRQADGQTVGNNLFHSFGRFNLNKDEVANFQSDVNIRNILSRVTGGSPSAIDGLITTSSKNVNLFLINPSGIIFGSNARLDVGSSTRGSFVATTVDALVWANGSQFSATNPGEPSSLLTIVGDPSGFLSSLRPPQPITSSASNLGVSAGQSLLLLGGNISLDGSNLFAQGGRVELAGVTGAGIVGLGVNGNIFSLNLPESLAQADVSLRNGANIVVASGTGNAGDISIQSGNISITSQASTAVLDASSSGQGRAGNVSLTATGSIYITGSDTKEVISTFGGNAAGDISLKANGEISLDDAFFVASNFGENGGNISLQGNKSVSLANNSSLVTTAFTRGNSGSIKVESSGPVSFQNSLVATNVGSPNDTSPKPELGNAGDIKIQGRSVSVTTGTEVTSRSFSGGNSGNIQINATDKVDISGNKSSGAIAETDRAGSFINSTLTTASQTNASGNAGNINIQAGEISINNLAGTPALDASTSGKGRAGNVSLEATNGSISLSGQNSDANDQVISTFSAPGGLDSGDISLIANGSISLSNAYLKASSQGENGGNISLQGNQSVSLANNSSLVSTAFLSGNSGSITVTSSGLVSIQNSLVSTAVGSPYDTSPKPELGNAGNIKISGKSISVNDGAEVSSRTFSGGRSGNILVNATDTVEISGRAQLPRPQTDRANTYVYSTLATSSEAPARDVAGDITVTTSELRVSDGANLRAESRGNAHGGSINIYANNVKLTGGGQLLTNAFGQGDAGNINLTVKDRIAISGSNPSKADLFKLIADAFTQEELTQIKEDGSGQPKYTPAEAQANGLREASRFVDLVSPTAASGIFANSSGLAGAGNLDVQARSIRLDNGATLSADTTAAQGNITLNSQDLVLSRGSNITTNAKGINNVGGNIRINTGVLAVVENSNISANSDDFHGGQVFINTQGDFLSLDSEITARGASPQFNGLVQISTPDVDPSQGLVQLPTNLVDASQQIDTRCNPGSRLIASSFIVTGRGGLPSSPDQMLTPLSVLVDWVTLNPSSDNRNSPSVTKKPTKPRTEPIVEATGWIKNAQGEVVLYANASTATPSSPWNPTKLQTQKCMSKY